MREPSELLKAEKEGYPVCIDKAVQKMLNKGIRLGKDVIEFALEKKTE
jgi:hypothetical protein